MDETELTRDEVNDLPERDFWSMKAEDIDLRPIYHYLENRVRAARRAAETARLREKHGTAGHPTGAWRGPSKPQPVEPVPARPEDDGPRYYVFEAVNVRLTPAAMEDGGAGWLAYGTLSRVRYPRQTGATSASSGSSGSSRDDRGGSRDDRSSHGSRETR